jgi:hypothetical protein
MADTYMQFEDEDSGLVARWHGGEYIDLGYIDADGEFRAGDVINVWDHAEDKPRIGFHLDEMQECVEAWLKGDNDDDEDGDDDE